MRLSLSQPPGFRKNLMENNFKDIVQAQFIAEIHNSLGKALNKMFFYHIWSISIFKVSVKMSDNVYIAVKYLLI